MKKRIIVIDDEPLIANLMKEIVEEDPSLEISQITTKKEQFLESLKQNTYDIAVIDISIGEREGGILLLKHLRANGVQIPVIMLSAHDEGHYALPCLKVGAQGYVSKERICDQIVEALKTVMTGHLFVSGQKGKEILLKYQSLSEAIQP